MRNLDDAEYLGCISMPFGCSNDCGLTPGLLTRRHSNITGGRREARVWRLIGYDISEQYSQSLRLHRWT